MYNTKWNLDDFWEVLTKNKPEEEGEGSGQFSRTHTREEFFNYANTLATKIIIDPLEHGKQYYEFDYEYVEKLKVFYCQKFIKDFIIRDGRMSYKKHQFAEFF